MEDCIALQPVLDWVTEAASRAGLSILTGAPGFPYPHDIPNQIDRPIGAVSVDIPRRDVTALAGLSGHAAQDLRL